MSASRPSHRLHSELFVPRPRDEVFAFFANPHNLHRITPPALGFEYLTDPAAMRTGLEIAYRIRPVAGVPMRWRSRIEEFDPPNGFVDVQLQGPYGHWIHRHRFEDADGGTTVLDEVEFAAPFGWLGDLAGGPLVRNELTWIFRYRAWAIGELLARPGTPTGRRVALVGGTGFVGGAVAAELRRRGDQVIAVSSRGEAARGVLPDDVEIRRADARTGDGLDAALAGVDAVVIALAFKNLPMESPRRHQTFAEVDAGGTEHVAQVARRRGIGRIAYVSGAGAAPDAERHWFREKWRAEQAIRASGAAWTIIRPTWIYGPRDVSLNRFLGFARLLPVVPMPNTGRQLLAPAFFRDAAALVADALTDDAAVDEVLELGGPDVLPMRTIIGSALRVAGLRRPILPGPTPLIKLGALPLTVLPEPPLTPDGIDFVNQPATVDTGPLLRRMPRRLTPLDEGLASYLAPPDSTVRIERIGAG